MEQEKKRGRGRPAGALTKKNQEIATKAAESGRTPLEVIIDAMRKAEALGDNDAAVRYANMAAPYMHPRLSSISANQTIQGSMSIVCKSDFPDA